MRNRVAAIILSGSMLPLICPAGGASSLDSHLPRGGSGVAPYTTPGAPIEPKNVPDFAGGQAPAGQERPSGTALKTGAESTTVPTATRLKLIVEYAVDGKTSHPGDIFWAHVRDDLFLGSNLIVPRGSLVRGRVVEVSRPRFISRAARVGLHLEQIVTPTGETVPLDAALEFQKGMTNQRGELDPGTSFATRVGSDVKSVTGLNSSGAARGALMAANIATLGAPAVATLIGSSAVCLFRAGDNISLQPGQELDVMLTGDLGLQL